MKKRLTAGFVAAVAAAGLLATTFISPAGASSAQAEGDPGSITDIVAASGSGFDTNGRDYDVYLQFKRNYKPYSVKLLDVVKKDYMGTSTPRDYRSKVHLVDETRNIDEKGVEIWMNNPLRFAGETFYQTSLFDGSEDADRVMSTTVVIGKRQTPADSDPEKKVLAGIGADGFWPVDIAYFDESKNDGEETPEYRISFKLHENGMSRDLVMDYGDFSMRGTLVNLSLFPVPAETDCAK